MGKSVLNLEAHVQICVPVVLDVCDTGVQNEGNTSDKANSQSDPAVSGHAGRSSEGGWVPQSLGWRPCWVLHRGSHRCVFGESTCKNDNMLRREKGSGIKLRIKV